MKNISIFGSTGSIGSNAVEILLNQKNDFNVLVPVSYTHLTLPTKA